MTNVTRAVPGRTPHKNVGVTPSSLGSNEVVAAVPNAMYRVLGGVVITTAANSVKFMSGSTDISATFPLSANGGLVLPFNEHGWFDTAYGEALNVNLGTATSTAVQLHYIKL